MEVVDRYMEYFIRRKASPYFDEGVTMQMDEDAAWRQIEGLFCKASVGTR
jgi:hypothetical protein